MTEIPAEAISYNLPGGLQTAGMGGTEEVKKALDISDWKSGMAYGQWIALPVSGPQPPARYKVIFSL